MRMADVVDRSGVQNVPTDPNGNEASGDPSGRRLSRSAENILTGPTRKGSGGRPASPQVSSKLSQGFKGFFNRKRDNDSNTTETSPTSTLESPPVSYAEDILNPPERPHAFNRVLQQIRSKPNMKKTPETKTSASKLQAARTRSGNKSDGSDTEILKDESRLKRSTLGLRDIESRSAHEDSDVGESGPVFDGSDVDEGDGVSDAQRTKLLMEHYRRKIEKTKESIKAEQKVKDDNVAEYLNLAEQADKQQIARIKTVFEKKNQKSNTTIAHLQKKLESNQRQLAEISQYGIQGHKKPIEVFQGMQQGLRGVKDNIKEGISGFSGAVVSKPKEFAKSFKSKFGSADNIDTMGLEGDPEVGKSKSSWYTLAPETHTRSIPTSGGSDEGSISVTSGSIPNGILSNSREELNTQPYEHPLASTVNHLQGQVREMNENQINLQQTIEELKAQLQQQYQYLNHLLHEERYKSDRLQEQLTDLTDLHQHAINNVQQEVAAVEERLDYRAEERLRDLQEHLENNVARVSKLEAGQQDQQVLALEDYSNGSLRVLLTKLANVVVAILAVILVFVSTISNTVGPFLSTRGRSVGTVICCIVGFYLWKRKDLLEHLLLRLEELYQSLLDQRTQ